VPLSASPAHPLTEPVASVVVQRLKSRQQFQAVMAGAVVAKTPHFALHRVALDATHAGVIAPERRPLFPVAGAWLGVLLPKRWARRAVTRNAIRRQIYEAVRDQAPLLPQAAWVVRLRSEFSRKQFVSATSEPLKRAVRAELDQLLGRVLLRAPLVKADCASLSAALAAPTLTDVSEVPHVV
jgi:ribonuclease P protein component